MKTGSSNASAATGFESNVSIPISLISQKQPTVTVSQTLTLQVQANDDVLLENEELASIVNQLIDGQDENSGKLVERTFDKQQGSYDESQRETKWLISPYRIRWFRENVQTQVSTIALENGKQYTTSAEDVGFSIFAQVIPLICLFDKPLTGPPITPDNMPARPPFKIQYDEKKLIETVHTLPVIAREPKVADLRIRYFRPKEKPLNLKNRRNKNKVVKEQTQAQPEQVIYEEIEAKRLKLSEHTNKIRNKVRKVPVGWQLEMYGKEFIRCTPNICKWYWLKVSNSDKYMYETEEDLIKKYGLDVDQNIEHNPINDTDQHITEQEEGTDGWGVDGTNGRNRQSPKKRKSGNSGIIDQLSDQLVVLKSGWLGHIGDENKSYSIGDKQVYDDGWKVAEVIKTNWRYTTKTEDVGRVLRCICVPTDANGLQGAQIVREIEVFALPEPPELEESPSEQQITSSPPQTLPNSPVKDKSLKVISTTGNDDKQSLHSENETKSNKEDDAKSNKEDDAKSDKEDDTKSDKEDDTKSEVKTEDETPKEDNSDNISQGNESVQQTVIKDATSERDQGGEFTDDTPKTDTTDRTQESTAPEQTPSYADTPQEQQRSIEASPLNDDSDRTQDDGKGDGDDHTDQTDRTEDITNTPQKTPIPDDSSFNDDQQSQGDASGIADSSFNDDVNTGDTPKSPELDDTQGSIDATSDGE